ncbi:MAG: hypothetical protein IKY03_00675 [Clostridia bacterium]|nr:hypothetical protein [Clostridia bacterium]
MKEYESPKADLLVLNNDLLTASGEDNPPEPCKCISYNDGVTICKATPSAPAYDTRAGF